MNTLTQITSKKITSVSENESILLVILKKDFKKAFCT